MRELLAEDVGIDLLVSKADVVRREPLPVVRGNETQLVQLLQNLIANAVKFRRGDVQAEVHVSARREDRQWVFAMRDNGIGIPREQAMAMIISGFIEPITRELPLEYAVELNRLIELEMEGSVG